MPKHKQRAIPVAQPSTNVVDLFLLAGLPNPLHQQIETFFQKAAGTAAKVISISSPSYEGPLYRNSTVESLLRAGASFAIRRLKNRSGDQSARPRLIALFYVPADDDQKLLSEFDFFVFPVPLRELAEFDETGHQFRHRKAECEAAIRRGLKVYEQELKGVVQKRIESRRSSEPLLLPPMNFHVNDRRVKHAFSELTRGARAWENVLPEDMPPETFDRARLPKFLGYQETQIIYKDTREVVFPCCRPNEPHGGTVFDHNAEVKVLRDILQSTYRFGASLPAGFHHDAQLEGGTDFDDKPFECSRAGNIMVKGTHANIYPNDYVKVQK